MLNPGLSVSKLLHGDTLVLDGAMGTELARRGIPTPGPLWSATGLTDHPDAIRRIHGEYATAGADIIVANTFRTNVRTLRRTGLLDQGAQLNHTAIDLAQRGAAGAKLRQIWAGASPRPLLVAASVAPVEDCYSPDRTPAEPDLAAEHAQMMTWLKAAWPDLVWIETMNTVREARAAARAASNAELTFVVSFVLRQSGNLLSTESLEEAVAAVEPFGPTAIGLNCIPPDGITAHLPRLRQLTELPLVAYAHINNPEPTPGWSFSEDATPAQYARQVKRWLDLGASIVGGCCGTTPAHIRAVRNVVDRRHAP